MEKKIVFKDISNINNEINKAKYLKKKEIKFVKNEKVKEDSNFFYDYQKEILQNLKKKDDNYKLPIVKSEAFELRTKAINIFIDFYTRLDYKITTFILSINILDELFTLNEIKPDHISLLSSIIIFLASKYEEVTYQSIDYYLQFNKRISKELFILSEQKILESINFNLCYLNFYQILLEFFIDCKKIEDKEYLKSSKTLTEEIYFHGINLKYKPSIIACSALKIIRIINNEKKELEKKYIKFFECNDDFNSCYTDIKEKIKYNILNKI
jgi:hypothetical protein